MLTTLNEVNKSLAPLIALMVPGKRVDSFLSVHADWNAVLISNSETSLVTFNSDERMELSDSLQTGGSINPNPLAFNLVPNASEKGLINASYQTASVLPFANYNQQYRIMYASSPFHIVEQGLNIETLQYHSDDSIQLHHGSLKAKNVTGNVELNQASISVTTWIPDDGIPINIQHSNVEINTLVVPEKSSLEADSSSLKIKHIQQQGKAQFKAVKAQVDDWSYEKNAYTLTHGSDLDVMHMKLPKTTAFQGVWFGQSGR